MNKQVNILNFWYERNYGALFTAFALYTVIEHLGYKPFLVDNMNYTGRLLYKNSFNYKFIFQGCNTIKLEDIIYKNKNSEDIYIAGSDQIFRPKYTQEKQSDFLLDFICPQNKKIAMAASFGVDSKQFLIENSENSIKLIQRGLQLFDYVSVREDSAVDICKNILNKDAVQIIDPVFIADKNVYEFLADKIKCDYSNNIVSYVLEPQSDDYKKAYKYMQKKYNTKIISLGECTISCEEWLNAIKNCKLLYTDSFHGVCFAIIFNKPFICTNKLRGAVRYEALFKLLGIENQAIQNVEELLNKKDCIFKVDYDKVNVNIEKQRQIGLKFLKEALEAPVTKQKEKTEARIQFLEEKICEMEEELTLKNLLKKELWNRWLVIYYHLPKAIQWIIRKLRGKN